MIFFTTIRKSHSLHSLSPLLRNCDSIVTLMTQIRQSLPSDLTSWRRTQTASGNSWLYKFVNRLFACTHIEQLLLLTHRLILEISISHQLSLRWLSLACSLMTRLFKIPLYYTEKWGGWFSVCRYGYYTSVLKKRLGKGTWPRRKLNWL